MYDVVYQVPVATGMTYPADVCAAVVTAALLEIQWRLEDYVERSIGYYRGLPLRHEAEAVLMRYRDILADYWWAVYTDPITYNIVVNIVTNERFHQEPLLPLRGEYQGVRGIR